MPSYNTDTDDTDTDTEAAAYSLDRRGILCCAVGVEAAPSNNNTSYDDPTACRRIVLDLFGMVAEATTISEAAAGSEDSNDVFAKAYKDLLETFDLGYATDDDFNKALFERVGRGLQALSRADPDAPFHVRISESNIVLEPKRSRSAEGVVIGGRRRLGTAAASASASAAASSSQKVPVRAPASCVVVGDEEERPTMMRNHHRAGAAREYAMGLARDAKRPPADEKEDPSCRCIKRRKETKLDHAAVLFERPAGRSSSSSSSSSEEWKVWKVLAAVELTVRNTGVGGPVDSVSRGSRKPPPPPHGPFLAARVIRDTIDHVVRDVAALGELPDRIPFAAVAGKRKKVEDEPSERHKVRGGCCWAHGHVVCPQVAGFPYAFAVDAFGTHFHDEEEEDEAEEEKEGAGYRNHASMSSLAAYADVLRHALQEAKKWLAQWADPSAPSTLPAPHPMCGKRVDFGFDPERNEGREIAPWVLAATPVAKYALRRSLRISQGELFEATVNVGELREKKNLQRVFWCCDAYPNQPEGVLIKVTSASCFNQLIPSVAAYLYGLEKRIWDADVEIRQALSQSLYGAYKSPGGGLVQLLPDLESQKYTALCPVQWLTPTGWSDLWGAFTSFVKGVLLPLAKYDIVHADIRAGHDVTSNVLYNPERRSMRLIDLDSLCSFEKLLLHLPQVVDDRNINPKVFPSVMKTSLGYVLVQVGCIAEAWLEEIPDHAVNTGNFTTELAAWYRGVYGNATVVNEAPVDQILVHYKEKIERKFR
jgi:hypothetical protein